MSKKNKQSPAKAASDLSELSAMLGQFMSSQQEANTRQQEALERQAAAHAELTERLTLLEQREAADAGNTKPDPPKRRAGGVFANLEAAGGPGTPLLPPPPHYPQQHKSKEEGLQDEEEEEEFKGVDYGVLPAELDLAGQPYNDEWLWEATMFRFRTFMSRTVKERERRLREVSEVELTKATITSLATLQWGNLKLSVFLPKQVRLATARSKQPKKVGLAQQLGNAYLLEDGAMAWVPANEALLAQAEEEFTLRTGSWTRALHNMFELYAKAVGMEVAVWGFQYVAKLLAQLDGNPPWEVVQSGEYEVRRILSQRMRYYLAATKRQRGFRQFFDWRSVVNDTMNVHIGTWAAARRAGGGRQAGGKQAGGKPAGAQEE